MQPIFILTGGMVSPLGQQSQSLSFANTVFNYNPHHSSGYKPMVGGFVGAEYLFNPVWAWQFGLALYQATNYSTNGEETQAPKISLDAVNIWNYHYQISSRQLVFENKLSLILKNRYRPYLIVGLGEGFNHAFDFEVTPQNSGEVATATFNAHKNQTFIYLAGLGIDLDVNKHFRVGVGYRAAYLGKYDFGTGMLDTGAGGSVFSLPALHSKYSYNQEVLLQLTCI